MLSICFSISKREHSDFTLEETLFGIFRSEKNISPEQERPSEVKQPLFCPTKVAVVSATTLIPLVFPVSEQIPDGMSKDKTGFFKLNLLID